MGATKTASSYLQRQLALNEKLLLDYGILVPQTARRTKPKANHHNLAWELIGDRRFKADGGTWLMGVHRSGLGQSGA